MQVSGFQCCSEPSVFLNIFCVAKNKKKVFLSFVPYIVSLMKSYLAFESLFVWGGEVGGWIKKKKLFWSSQISFV